MARKSETTSDKDRLIKLIQIALGMCQHGQAYQNSYCAKNGSDEQADWEALVGEGLAARGREVANHTYYHVTEDGAKVVGIGKRDFNKASK